MGQCRIKHYNQWRLHSHNQLCLYHGNLHDNPYNLCIWKFYVHSINFDIQGCSSELWSRSGYRWSDGCCGCICCYSLRSVGQFGFCILKHCWLYLEVPSEISLRGIGFDLWFISLKQKSNLVEHLNIKALLSLRERTCVGWKHGDENNYWDVDGDMHGFSCLQPDGG